MSWSFGMTNYYAFSPYLSPWVVLIYPCLGAFELDLLLDEGLCCNYAFVLYYCMFPIFFILYFVNIYLCTPLFVPKPNCYEQKLFHFSSINTYENSHKQLMLKYCTCFCYELLWAIFKKTLSTIIQAKYFFYLKIGKPQIRWLIDDFYWQIGINCNNIGNCKAPKLD